MQKKLFHPAIAVKKIAEKSHIYSRQFFIFFYIYMFKLVLTAHEVDKIFMQTLQGNHTGYQNWVSKHSSYHNRDCKLRANIYTECNCKMSLLRCLCTQLLVRSYLGRCVSKRLFILSDFSTVVILIGRNTLRASHKIILKNSQQLFPPKLHTTGQWFLYTK